MFSCQEEMKNYSKLSKVLFSILFIRSLLKYINAIMIRHPTALIFPKRVVYFLERYKQFYIIHYAKYRERKCQRMIK